MKKSLFGIMAVLCCVGMSSAYANRSSMYSSINMRNSEGDTIRINRSSSEAYSTERNYTRGQTRSTGYNTVTTTRSQADEPEYTSKRTYTKGETYRKTAKRKYFIANPFYQPLKGQFGSVTTGEYMQGTYKFADVDRKLKEWSIKEDLSFGLTDRIALQAMAKYDMDKLTWVNSDGDKDEYKNNELNIYGLGIQGRIVDTNDVISTISGYYEHQKHGVDYLIADFKLGYKVSTSTIYGLLRGWIVNMDGDIYGDYITNKHTNEWGMLVYGDSKDTLYMGELGLGVWTVLAEDWTLNVEGLFGAYDWHNQLSIKGAFGWQPNDWFALNLYAKTSLYDTANDKTLSVHWGNLPVTAEDFSSNYADVELSKFREWSVGLQVMFQF